MSTAEDLINVEITENDKEKRREKTKRRLLEEKEEEDLVPIDANIKKS